MGLKESLRKLQELERKDKKLSLKKEVNKALKKIEEKKILKKVCIICAADATYSIKDSSDYYCKDCAIEYFGSLDTLTKIEKKKPVEKIYVITGNKKKFSEIREILENTKQLDIDLPEIQELDPKKIIRHKLKEAKKHYTGEFIVEDTSLSIDCLNGLPGPLIKWFLEKLKVDGIYNITIKLHDTESENKNNIGSALAKTMIGYSNKRGKIMIFEGTLEGNIVKPAVKTDFGWDPIFRPKGYTKSFAEMSKEEKNLISMRRIALEKLKIYLKTRKSGK